MKKTAFCLLLALVILPSCISGLSRHGSGNDAPFREMAAKLSEAETKLPNKIIAVYGFEVTGGANAAYSKYATVKLIHEIVSLGKVTVVEGSRTDQVLKEQGLPFPGTIDANMAARIGRMLSVDAVVVGTIHAQGNEVELIARMIQSDKAVILSSVSEWVHAGAFMSDTVEIPETPTKTVTADNDAADRISDGANARITPGRREYTGSEPVRITFSGLPGNRNDWITLVKATEPDNTNGQWFYTYGERSGSHTFNPTEPGNYEIRLYFNWPSGGYNVQKRVRVSVR